MLEYAEMLNMPAKIIIIIVAFLFFSQLIGSIASARGVLVPAFMRIVDVVRIRRKRAEIVDKIPEKLDKFSESLEVFSSSLNELKVNTFQNQEAINQLSVSLNELKEAMSENHARLNFIEKQNLDMQLDQYRSTFLQFVGNLSNPNRVYQRDYWTKMKNIYDKYEDLIRENKLKNGEIEVSYQIFERKWKECIEANRFLD